jgi:hypothetical protein
MTLKVNNLSSVRSCPFCQPARWLSSTSSLAYVISPLSGQTPSRARASPLSGQSALGSSQLSTRAPSLLSGVADVICLAATLAAHAIRSEFLINNKVCSARAVANFAEQRRSLASPHFSLSEVLYCASSTAA